MAADNLPLHPPRYFRCQAGECGRKWHRVHMGRAVQDSDAGLFASVRVIPEDICPACGSPCEPEPGFVYGNHPPPPIHVHTAENAKWSYNE